MKDADEKPIAGVMMTAHRQRLHRQRRVAHDDDGRQRLLQVRRPEAGQYMVFEPNQPAEYKDGMESLGDTFDA